jgi:hypothetical protein
MTCKTTAKRGSSFFNSSSSKTVNALLKVAFAPLEKNGHEYLLQYMDKGNQQTLMRLPPTFNA